jgi:uncharacterized membrane protein HdeD (DUF308 family)
MNANEIDRALREDETIEPSPIFASRVMGAVRRQVSEQEAIAFPWSRLLPGLVGCAAAIVAAFMFAPPLTIPEWVTTTLRDPVLLQAATWVPTLAIGTWLLVWGSLRLAGYRR